MSGIIAQNSGRHTGLVKASSGGGGVWNLILTQTASSSATIDFTSGIDSTYDEYVFKFISIHPATDGAELDFNVSIDAGSNYNVTKTTTAFDAYHGESGSGGYLRYLTGTDLAQSTSFQTLSQNIGADNDQSTSGTLTLFSPSSTTFVKHFISNFNIAEVDDTTFNQFIAGYANTTSAVDAIQFKMSTGNIDAGTISLFGIT
jgi:hypothetical protein